MMFGSLRAPLCFTVLMMALLIGGKQAEAENRFSFNYSGLGAPQGSFISQSDQREIPLTDQMPIGAAFDWFPLRSNWFYVQLAGDYNNFVAEETQNNIVITHHLEQTQVAARLFLNIPLQFASHTGIRSRRDSAGEIFASLYGAPLSSKSTYYYESQGLINRNSDPYEGGRNEESGTAKIIGLRYASSNYTFSLYQDSRTSDLEVRFQDGNTYQYKRNAVIVLSIGMRFK